MATSTIKPAVVTAGSIPADRWEDLAKATGSDVVSQGDTAIAVAAFCNDFPGLPLRDMAAYMSLHYAASALSHTTIGQHKRLIAKLSAAIAAEVLTAEVAGKARKLLGTARYSWTAWETALGWPEVEAATDSAERSAMALRVIADSYAASVSAEAKAKAEESAKAATALKKAETAKAKAEREKATADAKAEVETEKALLRDEIEALRGSVVTVDGSPEAWARFAAIATAFVPYVDSMPRTVAVPLAALLAMAPVAATAPAKPKAPAKAPAKATAPAKA